MPVFNEAATVREIVSRVLAVGLGADSLELIIVDDGSTDGTGEILGRLREEHSEISRESPLDFARGTPSGRALGTSPSFEGRVGSRELKILRHPTNLGKGQSIRDALEHATGDVIVIQDADLEYDPRDFPRLLEPIKSGRASVVYGSRILGHAKMSHLRYYLGGRFLSLLTNLLYGSHITDEPTCYKMFRRGVLDHFDLAAQRFDFCPEFTAKVLKAGYEIVEVPIRYNPRKIREGKKIRWTDGLAAIFTLLRLRFQK